MFRLRPLDFVFIAAFCFCSNLVYKGAQKNESPPNRQNVKNAQVKRHQKPYVAIPNTDLVSL
ncbi:MAG: hypothetical protein JWM20_645 [Patescibacteria group bacterium]|nr:hypothetical protein [Patescibacteria group bacterium]